MDLRYPLDNETPDGLLVRLAEECAEVIKACTKAQRFGLYNHHSSEAYRNSRMIARELADVLEIRGHLLKRGILP